MQGLQSALRTGRREDKQRDDRATKSVTGPANLSETPAAANGEPNQPGRCAHRADIPGIPATLRCFKNPHDQDRAALEFAA